MDVCDVVFDVIFVDIKVCKIGLVYISEWFECIVVYCGMLNVWCGQWVIVFGVYGVIVGYNDSVNFEVLFVEDSEFKGGCGNVYLGDIKLVGEFSSERGVV